MTLSAMIRSIALTLGIGLMLITISCQRQRADANMAMIKQETDDRTSPLTSMLANQNISIVNAINDALVLARQTANPDHAPWDDTRRFALVENVYNILGGDQAGSGIGLENIGIPIEVSAISKVESWIISNLKPEFQQILFMRFKNSRYGDNPIGPFSTRIPAHLSESTSDHSIAPVVKISDIVVGIDKIGHFFQQGYWYFDTIHRGDLATYAEIHELGEFMEGHPDLPKALHGKYKKILGRYCKPSVILGGFGYYGAASTGVISLADIAANEDGFRFYTDLFTNPDTYVFHFDALDIRLWNEENNKNLYVPGLKVRP